MYNLRKHSYLSGQIYFSLENYILVWASMTTHGHFASVFDGIEGSRRFTAVHGVCALSDSAPQASRDS